MEGSTAVRTVTLTTIAMIAFAANSLLGRQALGQQLIDAASYTAIRIVSGAFMLAVISASRSRTEPLRPDWPAVAALSCYMVFFSFAYITLAAGTGALLLFGAVQLTMFGAALRRGERFTALSWVGLGIAFTGLVYLVAPGVTSPDPLGATLMFIAGVAWGAYSLFGAGATDPLRATAGNFIFAVPVAALVAAAFVARLDLSPAGVALAVASGAITSALGYAVWFAALRGLNAGQAATVQLSVPVVAAIGGALLLAEQLTLRLGIASALTLGGIALVLAQRSRQRD